MAGYTTVAHPVTGTPPSTTTFGIPVSDDLEALAKPARAVLYQTSATTTLTNSAWTAVGFDAETYDTAGGHSTSSNNSRYTAQTGWAGNYRCSGTVMFAGNITGERAVCFRVNGTTFVTGSLVDWSVVPNNTHLSMTSTCDVFLNAGDYVELVAYQASGAGLATFISTLSSANVTSALSLLWTSVT